MTRDQLTPVAQERHAPPRRSVVDLSYVVCVLVPLLVVVTSPAWYLVLSADRRRGPADMVGILAAGWTPWLLALVGTLALANMFGVERDSSGEGLADGWDRFARRMLAVTAGFGVIITLLLAGILASLLET